MPRMVFDGTKSEELRDLHGGHGVLHVLLVGKDQDGSISQRLWTEEPSPSQPARAQPPLPVAQVSPDSHAVLARESHPGGVGMRALPQQSTPTACGAS